LASQESTSDVRRRAAILAGFYLFFLAGAVWNVTHLFQPLMRFMTPFVLVAIGISAAVLTYELTLRSIAALVAVLVFTFLAEASGANLGFPFGDYAYTDMLGPKVLDVPLAIPFAWLAIVIPGWIAAERFLRYKHVVVASVVATAADALLKFAADSLDLWHWKDGLPTELNAISWFVVSYIALWILKTFAKEKPAHWIVPHLLTMQLLYFFLSDAGLRYLQR
jgi:putative membrane protein